MTGTTAQIEKVKDTIARIDVPVYVPEVHGQRAHVVRLKHISAHVASEILTVLIRSAPHLQFSAAEAASRI